MDMDPEKNRGSGTATDNVDTPLTSPPVAFDFPAHLFRPEILVLRSYRELIKNPRAVCNDWFYRFIDILPGHPVLWALLFGLSFPLFTHLLQGVGAPIAYARSTTEIYAAYFFLPTLLVQTLAMPVFYQSALRCFDELRHLMTGSAKEIARSRNALLEPGTAFQWRLLGSAFLVTLISEEVSASRFTRFLSGNWNELDLWLVFANSVTLMMFIWFVVMPISRTLLLAKQIETSVTPQLFDDNLGAPIGNFGLRAGLVFAIPYFLVNAVGVVVLEDAWSYLLPGFIGSLMAISFAIIPGERLRRRTRSVKNAELARVNAAVLDSRKNLGAGELKADNTVELVQLLQYRREVRSIKEWPFEARVIRGFSLYFLLIPLTWVASAVVQMIIERLAE